MGVISGMCMDPDGNDGRDLIYLVILILYTSAFMTEGSGKHRISVCVCVCGVCVCVDRLDGAGGGVCAFA